MSCAVLAAEHAREAPVHHVDLAEVPDHHVGGLEVAVDHALRVRVGHRLAHLEQHAERARLVPALLARRRRARRSCLQVAALDELHREVDAAVGVEAELVHRHDAGVVELAGDLRLLEEAREHARRRPRGVPPVAGASAVPRITFIARCGAGPRPRRAGSRPCRRARSRPRAGSARRLCGGLSAA